MAVSRIPETTPFCMFLFFYFKKNFGIKWKKKSKKKKPLRNHSNPKKKKKKTIKKFIPLPLYQNKEITPTQISNLKKLGKQFERETESVWERNWVGLRERETEYEKVSWTERERPSRKPSRRLYIHFSRSVFWFVVFFST